MEAGHPKVLNLQKGLWYPLKNLISYGSKQTGEGSGTPLQYSCLENPMDGGAWEAAVHGVTKSQTQLSDFTFTFHFHALEKEMATHSSVLAWRIPGTGEPGRLQSMGSLRVGHDWSDLATAKANKRKGSNSGKFSSSILLKLCWDTIDKQHCVSLRCTDVLVDTFIYYELMTHRIS